MKDPIEIAAKALRKEAAEFRDPVSYYVKGEALERWEDSNQDNLAVYDTPKTDWELESWKILARAFIAALEEAGVIPKWRPIETAPKNGTHILVWDGKDHSVVEWWYSFHDRDKPGVVSEYWLKQIGSLYKGQPTADVGYWIGRAGNEVAMDGAVGCSESIEVKPTHWMPLPAAPTYTPPAEERK